MRLEGEVMRLEGEVTSTGREQAEKEQAKRQQVGREQAKKEQAKRQHAKRQQVGREQAKREQMQKEEEDGAEHAEWVAALAIARKEEAAEVGASYDASYDGPSSPVRRVGKAIGEDLEEKQRCLPSPLLGVADLWSSRTHSPANTPAPKSPPLSSSNGMTDEKSNGHVNGPSFRRLSTSPELEKVLRFEGEAMEEERLDAKVAEAARKVHMERSGAGAGVHTVMCDEVEAVGRVQAERAAVAHGRSTDVAHGRSTDLSAALMMLGPRRFSDVHTVPGNVLDEAADEMRVLQVQYIMHCTHYTLYTIH
jgi:hypothetical protein